MPCVLQELAGFRQIQFGSDYLYVRDPLIAKEISDFQGILVERDNALAIFAGFKMKDEQGLVQQGV